MPLRPEWGVRVDPLVPGYAVVSTNRSWEPLLHGALILLAIPFVLAVGYNFDLLATLREAGGDLLERSLVGRRASCSWRSCGGSE